MFFKISFEFFNENGHLKTPNHCNLEIPFSQHSYVFHFCAFNLQKSTCFCFCTQGHFEGYFSKSKWRWVNLSSRIQFKTLLLWAAIHSKASLAGQGRKIVFFLGIKQNFPQFYVCLGTKKKSPTAYSTNSIFSPEPH